MQIEIVKPMSLTNVRQIILMLRKDRKWGFIRDKINENFRLPQYEVDSEDKIESSIMMQVFKYTRSFDFEYKAAFDFICEENPMHGDTHKANGRIFIVSIRSEASDGAVEYYSSSDIPEETKALDTVRDLLLHTDVIADMYF